MTDKQPEQNVYLKLIDARIMLQEMKLPKTGKNAHNNYSYYELGDFLPAINALCKEFKMITIFRISKKTENNEIVEMATITIKNAEAPNDSITFEMPTAEASLPKGQQIQNLGAKSTYMRRYMLMTAFEMVESDIVETVKREFTSEIEEADLNKINAAKTKEELKVVCGKLKDKYKTNILTTEYDRKLALIEQDESKA